MRDQNIYKRLFLFDSDDPGLQTQKEPGKRVELRHATLDFLDELPISNQNLVDTLDQLPSESSPRYFESWMIIRFVRHVECVSNA